MEKRTFRLISLSFFIVIFVLIIGFSQNSIKSSFTDLKITEQKTIENLKILAVGDIMLGRYVETLMNRNGEDYPFSFWGEFDLEQDIILGNLEGPINAKHVQTADFTTSFSFKESVAGLLREKGFSHLSLANNHTFDKGEGAFAFSELSLKNAGIKPIGHPRTAKLDRVVFEDINDQKIAIIGLNEAVSSYFSIDEAVDLTAKIQLDYPGYLIITYIHWGPEYKATSSDWQKEIAHKLIDSGSDLIIGHHPHVVQEVEIYNNKLIFYSLGNFIFDQYFSKDTQEGLALYLEISEDSIKSRLQGVSIDKSRPKPMSLEESVLFLEGLANRSSIELGEQIKQGLIVTER
jgi:poly-gamma-glutamate synthesis protein (capsule biosynthesis protein)